MKTKIIAGIFLISSLVSGCFSENSSSDYQPNPGYIPGSNSTSFKITKTIPEIHDGIARDDGSVVSFELSGAPLNNENVLCIQTTSKNKTCSNMVSDVKFIQGENDTSKTYIVAPIDFIMEDYFDTKTIEISLENNGFRTKFMSFENDFLYGSRRKILHSDNFTNEIKAQEIKIAIPYIRLYKFDASQKNNGYVSETPVKNNGVVSVDIDSPEKDIYEIVNGDGTANIQFVENTDGTIIIRKKVNTSANIDFRLYLRHSDRETSIEDFRIKNVLDDYKRAKFTHGKRFTDLKELSDVLTYDFFYNDNKFYDVACDPKPLEIYKTYNECMQDLVFEGYNKIDYDEINVGLKKVNKNTFENKGYSIVLDDDNDNKKSKAILFFNFDQNNIVVAESNNEDLTASNNEIVSGVSKNYISDSNYINNIVTVKNGYLFLDKKAVPYDFKVLDENNMEVEQNKIKTTINCSVFDNGNSFYNSKKCSYTIEPNNVSGLKNLKTVFKFGSKEYNEDRFSHEYSYEIPLKIVNKDAIKLEKKDFNVYKDSKYYVEKYKVITPKGVSISDLEVSLKSYIFSGNPEFEMKQNSDHIELTLGSPDHTYYPSNIVVKHKTRKDFIYESKIFTLNKKFLGVSDLYTFIPRNGNINLEADPVQNTLKYKSDGSFDLSIKNNLKMYGFNYDEKNKTFIEKELSDIKFRSLSLYHQTFYNNSDRTDVSQSKDFEISSSNCSKLIRNLSINNPNGTDFDKLPENFANSSNTCTIDIKKKIQSQQKISGNLNGNLNDVDVITFGYAFNPSYQDVIDYEGSYNLDLIK